MLDASVARIPSAATVAALAAEIERLHDRLRPTAAPEGRRDLFQFAAARVVAPSHAPVTPPPAVAAAPMPAAPAFKLIGIAEDGGVRTAILSAPGQLLMVRDGDEATSLYTVRAVSADAVELVGAADGSVLRLALK